MHQSWNGIQRLTRPVPVSLTSGPWVDIFWRRRQNLWVVWSTILPRDGDAQHRRVLMLGAFRSAAQARFCADTALAAIRPESGVMPMMLELMTGENIDVSELVHNIGHASDFSPLRCHDDRRPLKPLGKLDLERLTQQIERFPDTIQDWRFMWSGDPADPSPALIRLRGTAPMAVICLTPDIFETDRASYWIDGEARQASCRVADISDNILSETVLENLTQLMSLCDEHLRSRYTSESNADGLLVLLREEGAREGVRQIAQAFGTADFVGLA